MSFSKLALAFGASLFVSVNSQTCNQCSTPANGCVELVNDFVYGCYGTFGSAIGAGGVCGSGYHMCESANEAELYGLSEGDCSNTVPSGHHFWSLEAQQTEDNNGECYSDYGNVTYNDRPRDNLWGCGSSTTDISMCGTIRNRNCGPFNIACDASGVSGGIVQEDGLQQCPCDEIELFTTAVIDATVGGVMCCKDTIPTSFPANCDESITVWKIRPGFIVPTPNFEPIVGNYKYYGNNAQGYPRYVHQQSGSEITVGTRNGNLVLQLTVGGGYGTFYADSTNTANGVITNAGNNRFEITEDFWSPGGTDTSQSLTNNDHITLVRDDSPLTPELQMTATFSDCQYYGLENVDGVATPAPTDATNAPNPSPTQSPTGPTNSPTDRPTNTPTTKDPTASPTDRPTNNPVSGVTCPNYDDTVYADCSGDLNCANCQPWGCAQCVTGYYKMGNLKRCQSCTSNYPNCQQCGDWNGCTACNENFSLVWEATCNDQICQAN